MNNKPFDFGKLIWLAGEVSYAERISDLEYLEKLKKEYAECKELLYKEINSQ